MKQKENLSSQRFCFVIISILMQKGNRKSGCSHYCRIITATNQFRPWVIIILRTIRRNGGIDDPCPYNVSDFSNTYYKQSPLFPVPLSTRTETTGIYGCPLITKVCTMQLMQCNVIKPYNMNLVTVTQTVNTA